MIERLGGVVSPIVASAWASFGFVIGLLGTISTMEVLTAIGMVGTAGYWIVMFARRKIRQEVEEERDLEYLKDSLDRIHKRLEHMENRLQQVEK